MPFWDSLSPLLDTAHAALANPLQLFGLVCACAAALLVVVSAFVKTMIPLRWLAVGSNVGFIAYGLVHHNLLLVALNTVLLPVNLWRVGQMIRLTRRVLASAVDPQQIEIWLRPYMRARQLRAGKVIFQKGDIARRMYFLVSGEIELPEVGTRLQPGAMFGEIAFFAPDRRRSSSARCATACTVMSIDEDTFQQLVYQNPDFGLEVVRLIAQRLSGDVQRMQAQNRASPVPETGSNGPAT